MAEAPADVIQDPYLATLNLTNSEHIKLYNKEIFGLPENDRYDLTSFKWTTFTKNCNMLYPHLDSNKNFRLSHPGIEPMHLLNPTMSSHATHQPHKPWWTHNLKYCGKTTQEQV